MPTASIQPVNIVGAALLAQFSLLVVLAIASLVIRNADRSWSLYEKTRGYHGFGWLLLASALVTLLPLVVSESFSQVWGPLFGVRGVSTIGHSWAMGIMFMAELLCVTILVARSGGSQASPYQSVYFLLPVLAIFLREPLGRLLLYVGTGTLSFSWLMFSPPRRDSYSDDGSYFRFTYWFVSVACFAIATGIGYITRPR